jgi:hypothetical protein
MAYLRIAALRRAREDGGRNGRPPRVEKRVPFKGGDDLDRSPKPSDHAPRMDSTEMAGRRILRSRRYPDPEVEPWKMKG